jgi:hypothetical protein
MTTLKIPKPQSPVKAIGWTAGILTSITSIFVFWGTYGWITRAAYAEDEKKEVTSVQMQSIADALARIENKQDATSEKVDRNYDDWKCDEWSEDEIEVLLEKPDTELEVIKRDQKIKELDTNKKAKRCERFTE